MGGRSSPEAVKSAGMDGGGPAAEGLWASCSVQRRLRRRARGVAWTEQRKGTAKHKKAGGAKKTLDRA